MGMIHEDDKTNVPLVNYICDVYNVRFNYAIEVDGSYHLLPAQKERDEIKDRVLRKAGVRVFRVTAFDEKDLSVVASQILQLRKHSTSDPRKYERQMKRRKRKLAPDGQFVRQEKIAKRFRLNEAKKKYWKMAKENARKNASQTWVESPPLQKPKRREFPDITEGNT